MKTSLLPFPACLAANAVREPSGTAAGFLAAATQSLFESDTARALDLCRSALHTLGILEALERPESLGRALLDSLGPMESGTILGLWCREKARALQAGESEETAACMASRFVARDLNALEIPPADYEAAILQRRWHLAAVLTPKASDYCGAISCKLEGPCVASMIEIALCDLLRAVDPDNDLLPPPPVRTETAGE